MARHPQPGFLRPFPRAIATLPVLVLGGCGPTGPARVVPPAFSPAEVTRCVLDAADRNGDGECTVEELAAVPGLKTVFADLDTNKNGSLSEQEILQWLTSLREAKVALVPAIVCILQRGEPVPGVLVRITPEPCMGRHARAAEGTTDESGIASLRVPSLPLGAHYGIYRLEVTGKDPSGQPIAADYNSKTSLGLCVPIFGQATTFDLD